MPYEAHGQLHTPPDSAKLWRYMDLTKLLALLEDRTLYFAGLDELGDPWEGYLPAPLADRLRKTGPRAVDGGDIVPLLKLLRRSLTVSCWHQNKHESEAMWRLYLKSNEGIAIQTTVNRLKKAVAGCTENVNITRVAYIDYDKPDPNLPWNNVLFLAAYKRKSFEHEREVRAIVADHRVLAARGKAIAVDPQVLIQNIFVAPACPHWLRKLVEKVLARYRIKAPVKQSRLDEKPGY